MLSLSVIHVPTNSSSCNQSPPNVSNADKVENGTHVIYNCLEGYHFVDGKLTMTYECGCSSMADLFSCVGKSHA